MKLQSLQLYDFRSYETASVQLHPGVNLIVGENAQGKTNLLESVFYLSTGKSFRTARNQELIRFGAEFADLSCTLFSGGREQSLRAVLFSGRRPRQLYIGGVKQRSAAGLSGVLTTVLFCPDDLLILKSGSSGRRKILDTALCQLRPGYAQALAEYQKLYDSKSRILKDYHDAPSLLEPLPEFNYRMAQVGAVVIAYRAKFLRELSKQARLYHAEFSGGREALSLVYQTVSTVTDPFADKKTIFQQLLDHQQAHYRAELDSGQCLSGPHKDDFETLLGERSVKAYGSQGQTRTAAISLKLAERELFRADTGEEPVLLLDDVLSELDARRQDFVLNQIRSGQVLITCCEPERITNIGKRILWRADRSGRKRHVPEYRRRFSVRSESVVGVFDLDNTSCSKWTRKFLAEAQRAGAIVEATDELPKSFLVVSEYGENRVILTKYNAAVLLKRMQDAQRSPISAKGEAI